MTLTHVGHYDLAFVHYVAVHKPADEVKAGQLNLQLNNQDIAK